MLPSFPSLRLRWTYIEPKIRFLMCDYYGMIVYLIDIS